MPEIRGLSLTQPWAQLVVLGQKEYETRSWKTGYRGLLAIHASKGFPRWAKDLVEEVPFQMALNRPSEELTLGAIIGTVELVECVATSSVLFGSVSAKEVEFGDWEPGRYAWKLEKPEMFAEPIPCKGSLGLWRLDPRHWRRELPGAAA